MAKNPHDHAHNPLGVAIWRLSDSDENATPDGEDAVSTFESFQVFGSDYNIIQITGTSMVHVRVIVKNAKGESCSMLYYTGVAKVVAERRFETASQVGEVDKDTDLDYRDITHGDAGVA